MEGYIIPNYSGVFIATPTKQDLGTSGDHPRPFHIAVPPRGTNFINLNLVIQKDELFNPLNQRVSSG